MLIINCSAGADLVMNIKYDKLEIDLRLKTDHLTISATIGFADRTEQGNNTVLVKV